MIFFFSISYLALELFLIEFFPVGSSENNYCATPTDDSSIKTKTVAIWANPNM